MITCLQKNENIQAFVSSMLSLLPEPIEILVVIEKKDWDYSFSAKMFL